MSLDVRYELTHHLTKLHTAVPCKTEEGERGGGEEGERGEKVGRERGGAHKCTVNSLYRRFRECL